MMDSRDERNALVVGITDAFAEMDEILDERLQAGFQEDTLDGQAKLMDSSALEADLGEVGTWLGNFMAVATDAHRERLRDNIRDVRGHLTSFQRLQLTPEERGEVGRLERLFETNVLHMEKAVALHDALQTNAAQFIAFRNQLDDILDDSVQVLTRADLAAAQRQATTAIEQLRRGTMTLLAFGLVVWSVAAVLTLRRSAQLQSANHELQEEIGRRQAAEKMRARLLEQLVTVQEDERGRLARELHDQLGQELAALMLGIKGLPRPPADAAPRPGKGVKELEDLTGRLIEQVQTIAWELRPAALDHLGLHGALSHYVEAWAERTGLKADFHSDLEGQRLSQSVETALYRVAQEALTNVMKHAQARTVSLTLQRRGPAILMIVEDDGRGFVPDQVLPAAAANGRLGMLGMKERVALAGGVFEVESGPAGTTVAVRLHTPEISSRPTPPSYEKTTHPAG